MTNIKANVSRMFEHIEPWDVSNSVSNLGPNAGPLTWNNAMWIAEEHESWLLSPLADAAEGAREWALDTGAWDRAEVGGWTDVEALALFVQNVASEVRTLGADDVDMRGVYLNYIERELETDGGSDITGYYTLSGRGEVLVDYYTGV